MYSEEGWATIGYRKTELQILRSPLHPHFGRGCSIFHFMQFHVCSKTLCNPARLGCAVSTKCFKVAIVINSLVYVDPMASFNFGRMRYCVMRLELASIQNYIPKGLLVKPHDNWFSFSYDFILSGLKTSKLLYLDSSVGAMGVFHVLLPMYYFMLRFLNYT